MSKAGLQVDCISPIEVPKPLNWIGCVTNPEELAEIYNKYSFLVLPSLYEGMSLALLEGLACGLPIITTNVGFASEIYKKCPLFVVERSTLSTDELAYEFIDRISQISRKYEYFSKKACSIYEENYSSEKFEENWKKIIRGKLNE